MNMGVNPEVETLRRIRETAANAAPAYTFFFNTESRATEVFIDGDTGPDARPIAVLTEECSFDDRNLIIHSASWTRFLLALVDRARTRIRGMEKELRQARGEPEPGTRRRATAAQRCAMACDRADFRQWLHDVHQVDISDRERVASRVRTMLRVNSRAQLDTDPEAARRWEDMHARFRKWRDAR